MITQLMILGSFCPLSMPLLPAGRFLELFLPVSADAIWLRCLSRYFVGGGFSELVDFGVGEESELAEVAVGDFADAKRQLRI